MARIWAFLCGLMVLLDPSPAVADDWYGTAPFCGGFCPTGWQDIRHSTCCGVVDPGCGACCWTGSKALCRSPSNPPPQCVPRQTKVKCYVFVLICEDGYYSQPSVYVTCNTYACGICFGWGGRPGDESPPPLGASSWTLPADDSDDCD